MRSGRGLIILSVVLILIGSAPFLISVGAGAIASSAGCNLSYPGGPCLVMGRDIGKSLHDLQYAIWLWLLTLPVLILGVVTLLMTLAYRFWTRNRG